jgi:hypothetical protein
MKKIIYSFRVKISYTLKNAYSILEETYSWFYICNNLTLQETYPTDPVVSEALIHMSGQFQVSRIKL